MLPPLIKALRPHQWVKNILIFVPVILAHRLHEPKLLLRSVEGFLLFCAIASAGYLVNDIKDLKHDRLHAWKCKRPLASGQLAVSTAVATAAALIIISLLAGTYLSTPFALLMLVYFVTTSAYSHCIKAIAALDVITLALLYTVRVLAGGVLCNVDVSQWLLMFSMFFFFSLACIKRFAELRLSQAPGRGYLPEDLALISQGGISSGYLSVLILALYVNSHEVVALYKNPVLLWAVSPLLLYWITRVWLLVQRGKLDDDPVVFALKDKVSYLCAVILLVLLCLAKS